MTKLLPLALAHVQIRTDWRPVVVGEFASSKRCMKNPGEAEGLCWKTMEPTHAAIGPNLFLPGRRGIAPENVGYMNPGQPPYFKVTFRYTEYGPYVS